MIPGRASVVHGRYGRLFVAVPPGHTGRMRQIEGARWLYGMLRWSVPASSEAALREALAGLDVSWTADHRAVPRGRCEVCGAPLADALVRAGDRRHLGCLPAEHNKDEHGQGEDVVTELPGLFGP